jgi:DNA-directed RNA polymerase specialized sigma24 family protein
MSDSDAALVARTLGGDLEAYAALMARYRDAFGRYAYHMLGNREDAQDDVPSKGARPDAFEWRDEIAGALERLRPHYREAFLLRYVEGMEYGEMARITGVKEPALRMRVKRASDQLRDLLRDVHAG